jgi:malonyl-CoA decarboxylase
VSGRDTQGLGREGRDAVARRVSPSSAARPHRFIRRLLSRLSPVEPAPELDAIRAIAMCRALLSERGEVSGARLAADLIATYQALSSSAVELFFDILAEEFSPNPEAVGHAAEDYRREPTPANLVQLRAAVEPQRQELFRRFNMAPDGTSALVDMRRRLLQTLPDHPNRAALDADLLHLLRSWFNRGFIVLQRIDWRTSALVLERLIQYEAVHEIQGWHDLRRRLEADRRCYAFFHPALPEEPLIFIEVALTNGMSARVQPLLDPESPVVDPAFVDCAIFYSITNCQEGLRGVSFGHFLIKQVAEDLGQEFPRVRTFATMSPIPGFRKWLLESPDAKALCRHGTDIDPVIRSLAACDGNERAVPGELKTELLSLCAYYLLNAKRGLAPLDAVARFHLANGACLKRLNWMGDTSENGIRRSLGLTANYVYRLSDLEQNHEAYARDYRIAASREIVQLARRWSPSARAHP